MPARCMLCFVSGPENRPKTVPKRSPKRMPRPASFWKRFSTDFRSSEPRKSFKNIWKIDDFAKLGFAVPTSKNVDSGRHFGTQNASKINQNGGPKTDAKSIAFRTPFLSILTIFIGFWASKTPSKIVQKSSKTVGDRRFP